MLLPSRMRIAAHFQPAALARLGAPFATAQDPAPLPEPHWVARNDRLAAELGLPPQWAEVQDALALFSGDPHALDHAWLASVYSGHQFGVWAGQLGDGRALLLGETAGGEQVQLKGSGCTPYSRGADGRAVLRSSIREFLASEAMHALGIPTTRALCITGSRLPVYREKVETAAVLTRIAPSFIRFGHFEHFSWRGEPAELRRLADFVIDHFYPACRTAASPCLALFGQVVQRTAALIAAWQAAGFMHGVMNTDNMSILGLTLDYGPFQFMEAWDPGHVCNHSDETGRYAYRNQPAIAHWNLAALAAAMAPLIAQPQSLGSALDGFAPAFGAHWTSRMAEKLGFAAATPEISSLTEELLALLAADRVDYPIFWHRLTLHFSGGPQPGLRRLFEKSAESFDHWLTRLEQLALRAPRTHSSALMARCNPAVVLRNYMAEKVIRRAQEDDFIPIRELLEALQDPLREDPVHPGWSGFPPDWADTIRVSCSS